MCQTSCQVLGAQSGIRTVSRTYYSTEQREGSFWQGLPFQHANEVGLRMEET
jgi:hypothetical protein